MYNATRASILVLVGLYLTGCAAIKLTPGAERVRITMTEPGKDCKFVGDITGNQGNFWTGQFTSNRNMETGARNDLKNRAFAMGGNRIFLLTQRAGQKGSYGRYGQGTSYQQNVTLTGSVFNCPE